MQLSDVKEISSEILYEIKNSISNLSGKNILNTLTLRVVVGAIISSGVYLTTKDTNLTFNAFNFSFIGAMVTKFAMKRDKRYMFGKELDY